MARQCPRGHNGIEPEEVADDTSTKHPAPSLALTVDKA
jgi:hypothetical protein